MDTKALEALSAEEVLSVDISEIADVEGFVVRPQGLYDFRVTSCEIEELGAEEKPAIVLKAECTGARELDDESLLDTIEFPFPYQEAYFIGGKGQFGVRVFVTMFREYAQENGLSNPLEIVEHVNENTPEFAGFLKVRTYTDKETKEKKQSNQLDADTISFD